jgi:NADH:ubiquinone oxidoreductase subunit 4 (subunit M)
MQVTFEYLLLISTFAPLLAFLTTFILKNKLFPKFLVLIGFIALLAFFIQFESRVQMDFFIFRFTADKNLIFLGLCLYLATLIWSFYTFNFQRSRYIYLLLGANVALVFASRISGLLFFWFLHLIPLYLDTSTMTKFKGWRKIGIFGFYQLLAFFALVLACWLLRPYIRDTDLYSLNYLTKDVNFPLSIILLVMFTVFVRNGVFPFHSWVRGIAQDATQPLFFSFLSFQTGNILFYKVAIPLIDHEAPGFFPFISVITLFSGIYWALVAIGEKNLRLAVAGVFSAQLSIISTGFELNNVLGVQGGFIKWYALLLAFTGLGLLIYIMERKADIDDITNPQALLMVAPRMGLFFFLIGFAMIGLPFTLGFIGEDILIHNVIEHYPWLGLALTFTTSLNGFVLYRIYSFIFGGRHLQHKNFTDLTPFQSIGFIFLLVLFFIIGFYPNSIFH